MTELLARIDWASIWLATWETLLMTAVPLFFTILLGLPLGVLLFITAKGQPLQRHRLLYMSTSFVVNVLRSVPFIILLIVLIPFTVRLTGTSLGVAGAIPPLVIAATPFFARLVENVLREIDQGILEACQAMGISLPRIITGALLPEALPGIIAAATVTAVTLVSYTAMSGTIGGGGLGDLAIRFGYQRFEVEVMIITVFLLVVLVEFLQYSGEYLVQRFSRR